MQSALSSRAAKAFAGGGLFSVVLGLLAVLKLVMVPLLTRMLPVDVFSIWVLITTAVPIALEIALMGCGMAIVRELPEEHDPDRRRTLISTALWGVAGVGGVITIAIAVAAGLAPPSTALAIRMAGLAVVCWSMAALGRDALRGLERYGAAALCTAATGLGTVGIIGWLLIGGHRTLPALMAVLVVFALAELGIVLVFLRRELGARPHWATYRRLLRFGVPAAGYRGMRNAAALDRHLIGARSSLAQAGYFQVAATAAAAIELAEVVVFTTVEPFVYGLEQDELARVVERLVRTLGVLLLSAATIIAFAAPEVVAILAPRSYGPALPAIPCLVFAAAGRAALRLVTLGAGITRRTSIWALSAGAYLVTALAGIALVVPAWGLGGAAAVHVAVSTATLCLAYALARRAWPVTLPAPMLALLIAAGSIVSTALASDLCGRLAPLWSRAGAALVLMGLYALALLRPLFPRRAAR